MIAFIEKDVEKLTYSYFYNYLHLIVVLIIFICLYNISTVLIRPYFLGGEHIQLPSPTIINYC